MKQNTEVEREICAKAKSNYSTTLKIGAMIAYAILRLATCFDEEDD